MAEREAERPAGEKPGGSGADGDHRDLPTGTVTFLLTDIERSTRRWEDDADSMAAAVDCHYELLDEAISLHAGVRPVEQGEGDSVVAAFARPSDAVSAALHAQAALRDDPAAGGLRVRMAIHTGEATLRGRNNYCGPAIVRTARLRAIAHGGQVLLSRAAADVVIDRLPDDASLLDLGVHRLRDLGRPEQVFQLCHPELERDFARPLSLDALPNNLPVQLTSFVGCEDELIEVEGLLADARLVTLTGSGGCGKTRLAAQIAADIADRYSDGVWWVELAPVGDAARVGAAVMAAVGVRDTRGASPAERLADHLSGRQVLIVFDNCEHVLSATADLVDFLLRSVAGLSVIATSREALAVPGEISWRVPPMALPTAADVDTESLAMFDAVRLFIERAVRVRPNFRASNELAPLIAEICARLDGIPLAIELAAARTRMMTIQQVLAGLDDRFRLLTGGSRTLMARQQTLEASVQWSHALLREPERILLRRLSVFAAGFSLDAAERVCSGTSIEAIEVLDLLSQLVDKSLVVVDDEQGRYHLLESIRQFGRDQLLHAGETADVRDRHVDYYLALAERLEPDVERTAQDALDELESEHDNLLIALEWSLTAGPPGAALRLAASVSLFWTVHGYYAEAQTWLPKALAQGPSDSPAWAKAQWGLGHVRFYGMDVANGYGYGQAAQAEAAAQHLGDERIAARAAAHEALLESAMGSESAEAKLEDIISRARHFGDDWCLAAALSYLSLIRVLFHDEADEAAPLLDELALVVERTGNRQWLAWHGLASGQTKFRHGRHTEARQDLEASLRLAYDLGDPSIEILIVDALTDLEIAEARHDEARRVMTASTERMSKSAAGRTELLQGKEAIVTLMSGDASAAQRVLEPLSVVVPTFGLAPWVAVVLVRLGQADRHLGDFPAAHRHLADGLAVAQQARSPRMTALVLDQLARLARAEGELEDAENLHHESLVLAVQHGLTPLIADSLEGLAGLAVAGDSPAEGTRLLAAAETVRGHIGCLRAPIETQAQDADLAAAKASLGEETFAEVWNEGSDLTIDAAIAYARRARGERKRPATGWQGLTPSEAQVVALAAEGLTNADIGKRLFISAGTVKSHLSHIFTKLGVSTRAELATQATRRHLTRTDKSAS